jgi:hypothetical protein
METFIPTTETWYMMRSTLSNLIITCKYYDYFDLCFIVLVKWAKGAYASSPIEIQKSFLQKLIHFKATHLPNQWRDLLQDLLSSELLTLDGVAKMFEMLP